MGDVLGEVVEVCGCFEVSKVFLPKFFPLDISDGDSVPICDRSHSGSFV